VAERCDQADQVAEISVLWDSREEDDWLRALDRYWKYVKPANLELERAMEALDPTAVKALDAQGWYEFLLNGYFVWKYTAPNRYASTTKHLKHQAMILGLDAFHEIKRAIFEAAELGVREGLVAAMRIKGLGPAGASGLLALLFPARFGTADQFVVKSLRKIPTLPERDALNRMKPESLTVADAVLLIEIMSAKAHVLNRAFSTTRWTPRKIDKILWASERRNDVIRGMSNFRLQRTRCGRR
jgi:hypothetical protein